jgi:uncharacterized protein YbaP (TraB family)
MRTALLAILAILFFIESSAQSSQTRNKKYPSLLWEITGKGLAKPSYLFGTMHVSNKMVFNLSDSFYIAIKNSDVVALETDPGSWQEDFSRYNMGTPGYNYPRTKRDYNPPSDYLTASSLRAIPYEKLLGKALYSNPSMINNFLYRSNPDISGDFEEDTYLDLYIYQVGRKWNKKITGVEDFDESVALVKEAYADGEKDKNARTRQYEIDREFSYLKLEEAYRTGNLDLLDTIHKLNSTSLAFDEKFLYIRNEIQAKNIDSIIRTKASLFAGVGAAHLPGQRGVIELLRKMGYKLRPIKMTERDSRHKENIESARVPIMFSKITSGDGFFSVNLPGKLYGSSNGNSSIEQQQHTDMANGSYYMVTRIRTSAGLWGHRQEDVIKKVDSLLYENIPGKILQKQKINKNGYPGFDILNRTRRGDHQRYNILVTPNEVLIFKMSGTGEYVKNGTEVSQFFNSIQLTEYKTEWKKFTPSFGGFEVNMPQQPLQGSTADGWQFSGYDRSTQTYYQVKRTDVHQYKFVEEDSFDLELMEESFASSEFIDRSLTRKYGKQQGYPILNVKYRYKSGAIAMARFLIQGPHYYTVVAASPRDHAGLEQFIQSFSIRPFSYAEPAVLFDTVFHFKVSSPVPVEKDRKLEMYPVQTKRYGNQSEDESFLEEYGKYKDKIISNDSTGEKIFVSFYSPGRYHYSNDSVVTADSSGYKARYQHWKYRSRKEYFLGDKTKVNEFEIGDPMSSRMLRGKTFSRDGIVHRITTMTDTITPAGSFTRHFFDSFSPSDSLQGVDPKEKKSALFFSDFNSSDTLLRKRAIKNIEIVDMDSSDLVLLIKAIESLNWNERKYLDKKISFVSKLSEIPSLQAADYLKQVYFAAGDTLDLQYTALEALLDHRTGSSYKVFKDIMLNEPPVLDVYNAGYMPFGEGYDIKIFFHKLSDTLELTKQIFPELLPLITINDYEKPMINLLQILVDSNMVAGDSYKTYLSKLLIETKQELKKQVILEKTHLINLAQKDPSEREIGLNADKNEKDDGNRRLQTYATLLMPFYDKDVAVAQIFEQLLRSKDKRLKFNIAILMLQKNKSIPDTMIHFYASSDIYRYQLYKELKKMKRSDLFPSKFNNHISLAKSELMSLNSYDVPDSLVFLAAYPLRYKGKDAQVYFFRYRKKKDDLIWKFATVGLIPMAQGSYEFEKLDNEELEDFNFSELSSTRFDPYESLQEQIKKIIKRLVYSKRKSAAEFYIEDEENDDNMNFRIRD